MLRKSVLLVSFTCVVFLAAAIISCGGSSSGSKACTGSYNVVGDWNLTINDAEGVAGAIDSAGEALFFDNVGDVAAMPTITGACSFSGTVTVYDSSLGTPPDTSASASVTGNVTSSNSIGGTVTTSSGPVNFSLTPITALSGSPTVPSTAMQAEVEAATTPDILTLTFSGTSSSMSFTGGDRFQCTASGTFSQAGASNVYDFTITFSGTGCSATGTVSGLGLESNTDYFNMNGGAAGTYLYGMSSSSAFVMEIFP
jgi:hypothetical protein